MDEQPTLTSPVPEAQLPPVAVVTPPGPDVEALYFEFRPLLQYLATRKFGVPDVDAENLIQEVFLSFIQSASRVEKVRSWLIGAMCNASRHYWRVHARTEGLPDDVDARFDPGTVAIAEDFATTLTVKQALGYLEPRCQETLRLHYFEGMTSTDVAREFDTTTRYAEKLIHNCLKRVREIYLKITGGKR